MYTIRFDRYRRVLHLSLTGFWTMATIIQFASELLVRVSAIRLRHQRYAVLSDASDFPIQSTAVTKQFTRIMMRGVEMNIGPTAIIVASQLNKLQAERIFPIDRVRVFLDADEAQGWLDSVWP